jgi:Domain of unknown function (DUF4384)
MEESAMRGLPLIIVLSLYAPAGAIAEEGTTPAAGAKDLFYDPAGGAVSVKVPPPSPPSPAPAASSDGGQPPAASSNPTKAIPADPGRPGTVKPRLRGPVTLPASASRTAATKNRGLHYWIELEEPGRYVSDHEVFHSGQRIRLHFVSNSDGQILLIQLGASGTSSLLFPNPGRGLADNRLQAGEDRILPSDAHWFRFDANAGTERLLVLFARDAAELQRFPVKPQMGPAETKEVLQTANHIEGSKDLVIETETRAVSEIGTYGVNLKGEPVVLEISLQHR